MVNNGRVGGMEKWKGTWGGSFFLLLVFAAAGFPRWRLNAILYWCSSRAHASIKWHSAF